MWRLCDRRMPLVADGKDTGGSFNDVFGDRLKLVNFEDAVDLLEESTGTRIVFFG